MRRTLRTMTAAAALLLAAGTARAQVNPRAGYIVTTANDTIVGTIDYRTNTRNGMQCLFEAAGATGYTAYQPADLLGYRLTESGVCYVSRTLPVDGQQRRVFAQYLLQGGMSLYYLKVDGVDHYYLENEDGEVAEVAERRAAEYGSAVREVKARQEELKDATRLLLKSQKPVDRLWNGTRTTKELVSLVHDYNRDFCPDQDCQIYRFDDGSRSELKLRLRAEAGLLFGHLTAKGGTEEYSIGFDDVAPTVGVGVDLLMPRLSQSLALQALLSATRHDYNRNGDGLTSYMGHHYDLYQVKFWDVELQVGPSYSFLP